MADPVPLLVLLFVALLVVGTAWPLAVSDGDEGLPGLWAGLLALGVGVGVFAAGRLVGPAHALLPFTARAVTLDSLAAVSEEAFFRRLLGNRVPFPARLAPPRPLGGDSATRLAHRPCRAGERRSRLQPVRQARNACSRQ